MKNPRFYEYAEVQSVPRLRVRVISTILVLAAFGGFFWLAWYAYKSGTTSGQVEEVPVVEADETAFKTAPDDPGGMDVPHRDKTIYETIDRGHDDANVTEKVTPAPEEPVSQPVNADEETLAKERSDILQQAENPPQQKEELSNVAVAEKKPETVAKPVEEKPVEEKPKPAARQKSEPAAKPVEEEPAKATKPKAGTARVQLGAFRSSAEAEKVWKSIVAKNQSVLGKSDHGVEKADIPGKGIFFRLQVINISSSGDAAALCKKLSAAKQGCFVVK